MSSCFVLLTSFLLVAASMVAGDTATSWEYKTMLKTSLFSGQQACPSSGAIMTYLSGLEDTLWDMATTATCSTSSKKADSHSGHFALDKERHVKMHDTEACTLYNDNYIFRVRRDVSSTDHWEGTLKARTDTESATDALRPNVNRCCGSCDGGFEENKFEEDINLQYASKFSFSQKCKVDKDKNINKIDDVTDIWTDMTAVYDNNDQEEALVLVGGKIVTECVYKGFVITFDANEIGEFAVTLWYSSSTSTAPVVAEISFGLDNPATDEAECFWDAMSSFSDVDSNSMTKTAWMYDGFCP